MIHLSTQKGFKQRTHIIDFVVQNMPQQFFVKRNAFVFRDMESTNNNTSMLQRTLTFQYKVFFYIDFIFHSVLVDLR